MSFTNISNLRDERWREVPRAFAAFLFGICALCTPALSVSSAYAATVTEPIVISDPSQNVSGDGWEWVSAGSSGTLMLKDADIRVADTQNAEAAIVVPDGATIHLEGENSIAITQDSPAADDLLAAVYCAGHLTITGEPGASATVVGEGKMDLGIYCNNGLSVTGPIDLSAVATTVASSGEKAVGSTGIYVIGDLAIDNGASVSATGSASGLVVTKSSPEAVPGTTTITGAGSIMLGTQNEIADSLAASLDGDVLISNTESVRVSGSAVEAWAPMTISGTEVDFEVPSSSSDHALYAQQGLDILDGSRVTASSKGHVLYVLGALNVMNSNLRAESVGAWSTAIRVEGDVVVDNSAVTALSEIAEETKGISILNPVGDELAGTLTLKGSPSIVAEGAEAAIQFVSLAGADSDGVHVVLDPTIGAVEGGTLRYTERAFTDPDEFTMSIWSYATGPIGITDDFGLEGASQRVEIGAEHSLLYVTDNGDAVTGLEGIAAIAPDGTTYPAEEWLDGSHVGYYRFAKDLPAGTYSVSFRSGYEVADAAQIEVPEDGSSIFNMDFHSIEVTDSDHAHTWLVKPSTGERVSSLAHVLHGAKVEIGTEVDDSHRFVIYKAAGTAPEWENGDATKAKQVITVYGDTAISAEVAETASVDPADPDVGSGSPDSKGLGSSNLPATGDSTSMAPVVLVALAGLAALVLSARVSKIETRC